MQLLLSRGETGTVVEVCTSSQLGLLRKVTVLGSHMMLVSWDPKNWDFATLGVDD